ncbi:sensor histidine kinase [Dellaglioa sp. BT-FLS60]
MNDLPLITLQILVQDTCLLLIYSQISHLKISKKLVLAILLGTIIGNLLMSVLFYLLILFIFYYFGIKSLKITNKKSLAFFYSIYAVSFFSISGNLITTLTDKLAPNNLLLSALAILLSVILNWLILKIVNPDTQFLETDYGHTSKLFLLILNTVLFVICTLQYTSYSWENTIGPLGNSRYYLTISFFILVSISLFYLNSKIRHLQEIQIQEMQLEQIKDLTQYTSQIEHLYNEIRFIRHDFINITSSLGQAINAKDISEVETIFNSVFLDLNSSLENNTYQLGYLSKIQLSAIKSVISTKIIKAQQEHITVNIELEDSLSEIYIHDLDYIRIFTILFDNALEAAKESNSPEIRIAIIIDSESNKQFLIIKNSIVNNNINKKDIFLRGYSTKGPNRGQGLAIIRNILLKNTNVSLETEVKDFYFTQKITFEK